MLKRLLRKSVILFLDREKRFSKEISILIKTGTRLCLLLEWYLKWTKPQFKISLKRNSQRTFYAVSMRIFQKVMLGNRFEVLTFKEKNIMLS